MIRKRCCSEPLYFLSEPGCRYAVLPDPASVLFAPPNHAELELAVDVSRCPECKKRLMAMTDRTGRTKLVCLKCHDVDPMKTDAAKWASSGLASGR